MEYGPSTSQLKVHSQMIPQLMLFADLPLDNSNGSKNNHSLNLTKIYAQTAAILNNNSK